MGLPAPFALTGVRASLLAAVLLQFVLRAHQWWLVQNWHKTVMYMTLVFLEFTKILV